MAIIKFLTYQKQIPWNLVPVILQTKVCVTDITQNCCGHYIFGNTFFIIHLLVSVADCRYVHLFWSYSCKNEAVKLSFTVLHLLYISPADLVSCNTSQIFSCCTYWLLKSINDFKINVITSQVNVVRKQEVSSVVRRLFNLLFFFHWF